MRALLPVPVAVLAALAAILGLASSAAAPSVVEAGHPDPAKSGAQAYGAGTPATVCGSRFVVGPRRAPVGAVVVPVGRPLDRVVARYGPGTTYFLTAGRHTLGAGAYRQVEPKSGDTFVGAAGAVLDGREVNRYAFGGHGAEVTIRTLTVEGFGTRWQNRDEGVVNHDAAAGWRLIGVTVRRNGGAGVMLGDHSLVRDSCLVRNGQYGFSAYRPDGVRDVRLVHDEIAFNDTAGWESRIEGCGCTGGGKLWATRGAVIQDNDVHDNHGVGVWADTNDTGFLITGNTFADNDGPGVMYETSYNAQITRNTFVRNAIRAGRGLDFPEPALYLSESGADPRAGARYGRTLLVAHNLFLDNWSGVVLWENADRFAGSPANTSTGVTTLVDPKVATEKACGTPSLIGTAPYVADCRWKTQHVRVTGNRLVLHPGRIRGCTASSGCGFVGLFSQYGTYPDWSPYRGDVVEDAVTFHQDNHFTDNTYIGPWRFMAHELGHVVSWSTWRRLTA